MATPVQRTRSAFARMEPDPWLGRVLQRPAFRLVVNGLGQDLAEETSQVKELLEHAGPGFIWCRVPVTRAPAVQVLQRAGLCLVDTTTVFQRIADGKPFAESGVAVRPAGPGDEDAVAQLAGTAFSQSRFHLDTGMADAEARHIKEAWGRAWFRGERGDRLLLALLHGQLAGFNLLLIPPEGPVTIDLIAVGEPFRRRGIARALILRAMADAPAGTRIRAGTQVSNYPAIRLYEQLEFQLAEASYVLHYHGDRGAR